MDYRIKTALDIVRAVNKVKIALLKSLPENHSNVDIQNVTLYTTFFSKKDQHTLVEGCDPAC